MPESVALHFSNRHDSLHIIIVLDDDGDGQFVVSVLANGFSGQGIGFYAGPELERFSAELTELAKTLIGEARLTGAGHSPEAVLTFRPITSRGYYAVEGCVTSWPKDDEGKFKQALSFIFEVELAQIEKAARKLADLIALGQRFLAKR